MYIRKLYRQLGCLLAVLAGLSSCVKDDYAPTAPTGEPSDIILGVTLPNPMPQGAKTRANLNNFNVINDLNVVVAQGDAISNVYYFETYTTDTGGDPSMVVEGDKATITISRDQQIPDNADIYLLANYGQQVSASTVTELKAIRNSEQGQGLEGRPQDCYMFARASEAGVTEDRRRMAAELKRTVAMVTLKVDGTGLAGNVKIEPRNIRLCQVPASCAVGNEGQNMADEGNVVPLGDEQSVSNWGNLGKGINETIGTHDEAAGGAFIPLFLYENAQPDGTGSETTKDKTPAEGRADYCTYIEFEGYYTYDNTAGNKTISGTVKYRYYLGRDGFQGNGYNKFDVLRNTHYQVTLTLSGLAVTEGGQLDDQGNLITEGQGNWRVETDLGDFNYSVPTNVVNGCGQFLPITVDANSDWTIRATSGDGSWLWFYHDYGSYGQWMTADNDMTVSNGSSEVILFVQPLSPEDVAMEIYPSQRSVTFTLTSGSQTKEFTLTQYAPLEIQMPKFDDAGNIVEGQTEKFWVEAVDRYAAPWGFENVSFDGQHTSGAYSMDNMEMLVRDYRQQCLSYMPYGMENGGSAMMVAAWDDCVSVISSPDNNLDPYDHRYIIDMANEMWDNMLAGTDTQRRYYYSVPSIVEWQYIEKAIKAGTVDIGPTASDINKRLNPGAEYWTSNHAIDFPGESYTYQIGRGLDELKRGEDVYTYHRHRTTPLRYRLILKKNPKFPY